MAPQLRVARYGTKRVAANQVYQEYISDKLHLHMNATKWPTLTDFVKHLGKESLCEVQETEKGWFITYNDRDPEMLARAVRFIFRMHTATGSPLPPSTPAFFACRMLRTDRPVPQEAVARKERLAKDEEERDRIDLERQIERAKQAAGDEAAPVHRHTYGREGRADSNGRRARALFR